MELFVEETKELYDKAIIENLIQSKHKILVKYTSEKYYKYSVDLLETLCTKSNFENEKYLFHISLYYLLKILYNCENTPCLNNYDLLILCSFSIGTKVTVNQHNAPTIKKIKNIYKEKYSNYNNEDIQKGEIICLKLLEYKINVFTAYEGIFYLAKNIGSIIDASIEELEKNIFQDPKNYMLTSPLTLAQQCINKIKEKTFHRKPVLITRKIIPITNVPDENKKKGGNESVSTASSSFGSNNGKEKPSMFQNLKNSPNYLSGKAEKYTVKKINQDNHYYNSNKNNNNKSSSRQKKSNNNPSIKSKTVSSGGSKNNSTEKKLKDKVNKTNKFNRKIVSGELSDNSLNINNITFKHNETKNNYIVTLVPFSSINNVDSNLSRSNFISKNYSGKNIFRKPTLEKKNMKTSFTIKKKESKDYFIPLGKDTTENKKNINYNYQRISDLCQKINFDAFNICNKISP